MSSASAPAPEYANFSDAEHCVQEYKVSLDHGVAVTKTQPEDREDLIEEMDDWAKAMLTCMVHLCSV